LIVRLIVAADLGAGCVSLWSGVGRDGATLETFGSRLADGLAEIVTHAAQAGVGVAFEPEPGMVIDTLARAATLFDRLGRPAALRLTVDIGHMECMGELPSAAHLRPWHGMIANVHVDDMLACRHEHLPLGTGDVDLTAALAALAAAGYRGGLHVELPRQSHRWLETARQSAAVLKKRCQPPNLGKLFLP
jgi:sugar phosphate isomerase/epimerase